MAKKKLIKRTRTRRLPETPVARAIAALGGVVKAAAILNRKQPTISGYYRDGRAPADVCMQIETATGGKYRAEVLRPDLANHFKAFRQGVAA